MALDPGERVRMIKAIGNSLMNDGLPDIDLALVTFGVPAGQFDGYTSVRSDKYEYVLRLLASAQDAAVTGLHAHLNGGAPTPDEPAVDPPVDGQPLIFISHAWKDKVLAGEISDAFAELGIKGFVAHEDIKAAEDWATEIERNLHACSALVAVLTDDSRESAFCNQEVGYAFGRGRLVIAVMQDRKPPPGLAFKYQAIPGSQGSWKPGRQIALRVLDELFENAMTRPLVAKSVAMRYAGSVSFDDARANYAQLLKIDPEAWTSEMVEIVEKSGRDNGQLREGYATDLRTDTGRPIPELVNEHLDRVLNRQAEATLDIPATVSDFEPATAEDDIPF
jgi:TIR domain